MTHILDNNNTILNKFLEEIRDINIQKDSMRFRRNLERIGEIMAYEISKTLDYEKKAVETPQGEAIVAIHTDKIVLATIMRAGVPYHQGFLNIYDNSESAFVSAYRRYGNDNAFKIRVEYISCGDLTDKTLILVDPMLATGASMVMGYNALIEKGGIPKHTHFATAIASEEGVEYVLKNTSADRVTLWCGSVDEELTIKSYIVPGLGDAGDLAYGLKI